MIDRLEGTAIEGSLMTKLLKHGGEEFTPFSSVIIIIDGQGCTFLRIRYLSNE